jgi:hypothetical protein
MLALALSLAGGHAPVPYTGGPPPDFIITTDTIIFETTLIPF